MTSPVCSWPVLARVNFRPIKLELWTENVSYFFYYLSIYIFINIFLSSYKSIDLSRRARENCSLKRKFWSDKNSHSFSENHSNLAKTKRKYYFRTHKQVNEFYLLDISCVITQVFTLHFFSENRKSVNLIFTVFTLRESHFHFFTFLFSRDHA